MRRDLRRPLATLAAALATALTLAGCSLGDDDTRPGQVGATGGDDQAAEKLGFPSTATRNTVRIGGGDATTDAAGVANALFPATNESDRPTAVVLVDRSDWQSAVAASVLAGPPIGAPLLLADGSAVPPATADTLDRLKPRGSDLSKDAQVIRIGDGVARPSGYKTAVVEGDDAYERAAAVDRFFSAARGRPSSSVVLYSGEDAAFAMPAAAWAARSGDAALPVKRDSVPAATRGALREHGKPTVYVLGPPQAVSNKVLAEVRKLASTVRRISAPTPVESAIAFARYRQGNFGWGVECRATTSRWRTRHGPWTWPPPPHWPAGGSSHRSCSPTRTPTSRGHSRATCSACSPATSSTPARRCTTASGSWATRTPCRSTRRRGSTGSPS